MKANEYNDYVSRVSYSDVVALKTQLKDNKHKGMVKSNKQRKSHNERRKYKKSKPNND